MARIVKKTELANKALSLLGEKVILNNIDDAKSASAGTLNLHLESAFESALLVHDWSFATGFTDGPMTVVREEPTSGFQFAYQYPKDALRIRQLASQGQIVHHVDQYVEDTIQFREILNNGVKEIHTNLPYATCEFTRNISIESAYPASFARIASAYLALDAGPGIISDNFAKVQRRLDANINKWIQQAIAEDILTRSAKIRPPSPFITVRSSETYNGKYSYSRR